MATRGPLRAIRSQVALACQAGPLSALDVTAAFHQHDGGVLTTQDVVTMDTYDEQALALTAGPVQ